MSLRETVNNRTGVRRYYINAKRVTRERMDTAKAGRRLDCFQTTTHGNLTRQYCEAN